MFGQRSQSITRVTDGFNRRRDLLRQCLADGGTGALCEFGTSAGYALAYFGRGALQLLGGGLLSCGSFLALLGQVAGEQGCICNEFFHPGVIHFTPAESSALGRGWEWCQIRQEYADCEFLLICSRQVSRFRCILIRKDDICDVHHIYVCEFAGSSSQHEHVYIDILRHHKMAPIRIGTGEVSMQVRVIPIDKGLNQRNGDFMIACIDLGNASQA
ncbi:hypothetical protein D3C72_1084380 [compost metagenome]